MNTTKPQSVKHASEQPLLDFLHSNKIPYAFIHLEKVKKITDDKQPCSIPTGWAQMNFDELVGDDVKFTYITKQGEKKVYSYQQRYKQKKYYNGLNINLNKGNLVIADIDDAQHKEHWLSELGNKWITYSTRKKLPHIWLKKASMDDHTTKTKLEKGLDLLYQNVFEYRDSVLERCNDPMRVFDEYHKFFEEKQKTVEDAIKKAVAKPLPPVAQVVADLCDPTVMSEEQYEILDNIALEYIDNYTDWLRCIWALYNTFGSIKICAEWSAKSAKYKSEADVERYIQNDTRKVFTFGTIAYYSRLSDADAYYEIKSKYFDWEQNNDFTLAELYIKSVGDEAICDANSGIYIYGNRFWTPVRDKEKARLKMHIYRTLYQLLESQSRRLQAEITKNLLNNDKENLGLHQYKCNTLKNIQKAKQTLGSANKLKNIASIVAGLLSEEEKIYNMDDLNPMLFCFKNKTFNLDSMEEVNITKYDYISMHTGYDFSEPTEDQIKVIDKLFKEIMPEDDKRKGLLSAFKSAMTGEQTPHFFMLTGEGSNGKGTLLEILNEALGNYYSCSNVEFLTTPIRSGASTTLYGLDKMRGVQFSEPEENQEIMASSIKKLTDNPKMKGRGLYMEKEVDIVFHNSFFMDCNALPQIKGRKDYAVLRRILVYLFGSTFVDKEEDVDEANRVFLKDTKFKETTFKLAHRCAMCKYIMNNGAYPLYKAPSAEAYSRQYLLSSDEMFSWFSEFYECTKDKTHRVGLKDIYNEFKQSEFYRNLSGSDKTSKWSSRQFKSNLTSNIAIKKYCNLAPKTSFNGTSIGQHIWGWKEKNIDEDYLNESQTEPE